MTSQSHFSIVIVTSQWLQLHIDLVIE